MAAMFSKSAQPLIDDHLVDELLRIEEGPRFEFKRVAGEKLTRALETIVAFANTDGGDLVLGIEDDQKASGRDRVYGVDENPTAVDELLRLIATRITPALPGPAVKRIGCTLRDGSIGSVAVVRIEKSDAVHSITLDGTWQRMSRGNRELVADEITRLSLDRGRTTAEARLAEIDLDLLRTEHWDRYASQRRLTRPFAEALRHLGLARSSAEGRLVPTWAAVLLFADDPSGLLATKAGIRLFHYRGDRIEHAVAPNLLKPPATISGPLILQIAEAYQAVIGELASGVQMGAFGFEVVQKYPTRVIKEAITNAVIHRDYSLPVDIHIRIFADRLEVISPGSLPGRITTRNIRTAGSFNRNPMLVQHLREFPEPPNLDAGEGVMMMFNTMDVAGLYPPMYLTGTAVGRHGVLVVLRNESRLGAWDQVTAYLEKHGTIGNAEVRRIMRKDALTASKVLKGWVDRGLLDIANPSSGKRIRRYKLPDSVGVKPLFSSVDGKETDENM